MKLNSLRYTHDEKSRRCQHGAHAGLRIGDVTNQLLNDELLPTDASMVLDVVQHHGFYRSLNNKHLDALKRVQEALHPKWMQHHFECTVRVWPLSHCVHMHGKAVVDKLCDVTSTRNGGRSVPRPR